MLTVTTTHIKQGWIRRNGILPESESRDVDERFHAVTATTSRTSASSPIRCS